MHGINIRILSQEDIPVIAVAFACAPWYKPEELYHKYLHEQNNNERCVWLAFADTIFTGYVTLVWQSRYSFFKEQNIPEIVDLNVLPEFRGQGIGAALLATAEKKAGERAQAVGLGVGLYADYGPAQRLYSKHGYIPDGKGITYNYTYVEPGSNVCVDDDLVLWLIKKLV